MKSIRKLIALISTSILTLGLFSGCSNNRTDSSKVINVFNCADYIDEELITKFEEETGYIVKYSTYDTNENMYAKLTSGSASYDLVFPSDYMIEKMISENLVQEINYDNVPNYKYIDEAYKHLSYDPEDKYSVPYMWGTIGILYNPENVPDQVDGWNILWNDEYKDEIVMFNSIRDTMGIALRRLGYSMNTTNHQEIKEAADTLIQEKKLARTWVVDEVKDMMISGEVSIATVYSGDAAYIQEERPDLEYIVPEEGSNKWFDGMVIPRCATNKEGAEAFINFLTDPDNAKQNVDYIGYYTPNFKTFEMLDEEIQESYPSKKTLDNCEIFKNLDKETLDFYNSEWIRIAGN